MKKTHFLIILFIFSSCSVSKELKEERKNWGFNNWKREYKDRALCLCVLKGYENKEIENILLKSDKTFYNPLAIAIFDESLQPIINDEIKKIRLDSIKSRNAYPEDIKLIYERRQVLGQCVIFYNSKKLDSITNKESKNWKKITSIIDEIHKKIPSY